jgi:hypothetical protein
MSKALIIIDMWDKYHPGHDRFTNLLEQLSLRLKSKMHKMDKIPIVVASYDTPIIFHGLIQKKSSETPWSTTNQTILDGLRDYTDTEDPHYIVSWDKDEVVKFLNSHNVTDLYFAGASFPGCVRSRPLGIDNMKDNFNCHVIIDCVLNTLGIEYTEYDIIHDTYRNVFVSGLSYIHSDELIST